MTETVMDWRPFDYVTLDKMDSTMLMKLTIQFEPLDDGQRTRVHEHLQIPTMKLPRWLKRPMINFVMKKMYKYEESLSEMARLMSEEAKKAEAS
jgi:hypothetical protein